MESTRELVTSITTKMMRTMFKMNFRVFGVTLLVTCYVQVLNTDPVFELLESSLALEMLAISFIFSAIKSSLKLLFEIPIALMLLCSFEVDNWISLTTVEHSPNSPNPFNWVWLNASQVVKSLKWLKLTWVPFGQTNMLCFLLNAKSSIAKFPPMNSCLRTFIMKTGFKINPDSFRFRASIPCYIFLMLRILL